MAQLYAPTEYWNLSAKDKARLCNGCGTKGLGGLLVPDTLYGLSIESACNIHDYQYHRGSTIEDKHEADRTFLNNMIRIIEAKSGILLRWIRRYRAMSYYTAVRDFGGPAFWSKKNSSRTIREVSV